MAWCPGVAPLANFLMVLPLVTLSGGCPCVTRDLCQPIRVQYQQEIMVFVKAGTGPESYRLYDWERLTVVALNKHTDDQLMCYSHARGARVVLNVGYPGDILLDPVARDAWVAMVSDTVTSHYMDGIHLDFEDFIDSGEPSRRRALLDMFTHLSSRLKHRQAAMQVTIDFVSDPLMPHHDYGYTNLMKVADFAFLRTYDERNRVTPPRPCVAWATDSNNVTIQGLKRFLDLGIPSSKLILGFAWFGRDYQCSNNPRETGVCRLTMHHGICTSIAASTHRYAIILESLVPHAAGGVQRDNTSRSPYINYQDSRGNWHQVWYNDPVSLGTRYSLMEQFNLKGVGVWSMSDLDYGNSSFATRTRQDMLSRLPRRQHIYVTG